jgi:RNA polymerase sigma-70 factor (family 1)
MHPEPSIESRLLHQLMEGDAQAFKEIYSTYQRKIFSFAFYLTKSKDVAEEIVQEVFIKLWEKRQNLREDTLLLPFLKKVTQNHVLDTFRKANSDKQLQKKIFDNLASLHQVDADVLMEKQLEKVYLQAIEKLPPQKKIIYLLHRDEELTYEEIATKLGLSKNTVRNHMTEAIHSIRDHVRNNVDLACLVIAMCIAESN